MTSSSPAATTTNLSVRLTRVTCTGIAWLAVEGIPTLHELVGLGIRHLQVE